MPDSLRNSIYEAIASIRLIDPHTHINPHAPASSTLADLLGYHYYTELAHSAGMPKDQIEEPGISPRELVRRLVSNLSPIENTAQYSWLVEICRNFFGFDGDRVDLSNWEQVYDTAERQMSLAEWPTMVLEKSNVEAVFLTNDFDDDLAGFDTDTFIPCLRTDDLVFHLPKSSTRQRLESCTAIELDGSLNSLRSSLQQRFEHFVGRGARACAISLPPSFEPLPVSDGRATTALNEVLRKGSLAGESHQVALSRRIFWTLAELCDQFGLPFDLMIGVNRGVYAEGVFQGQDLFDSRVSLIQYRELFNAFPAVKFPISVLASVTNQELVSYSWIFPNVITNGHWWYSNTPSIIARDAGARLEAVPQTKQIGYYSDAYKLEFVWPKFDMYRRVLAGVLADQFVRDRGWSEERAIELARQVLRDNVDAIFPKPQAAESSQKVDPLADTWTEDMLSGEAETDATTNQPPWESPTTVGTSSSLSAGAIGIVEVNEAMSQEPDSPETVDDSAARGDQEGAATVTNESDGADDVPSNVSLSDDEGLGSDAESVDNATVNDTVPIETVLEEADNEETVRIDGVETSDPTDFDTEILDLPTKIESEDTVQLEQTAEGQADKQSIGDSTFETIIDLPGAQGETPIGLDPLPTTDEIQTADVEDVELRDLRADRSAVDTETIDAEVDDQPLDVGDLLADDEPREPGSENEIRMLRGEESFELGEESLKLKPDPLTGELRMSAPDGGRPTDESNAGGDDSPTDDELLLQALEETTEMEIKPSEDHRVGDPDATIIPGERLDLELEEPNAAIGDQDASVDADDEASDADDDTVNP